MRGAMALVLVGVLFPAACGGDGEDAADTTAVPRAGPIVIRTRMVIAAVEGSEPIARGKVLEGSKLAGSRFCAGGTIRDTHAKGRAAKRYGLIERTITCSDGTVTVGFTPEVAPPGQELDSK